MHWVGGGRIGLVRTGMGLNLSSSKTEADPDVAGQCWLQGLHHVVANFSTGPCWLSSVETFFRLYHFCNDWFDI